MNVEVSQLCHLITLSQYSVAPYVVLKRLDSHDVEVDLHLPVEYFAKQIAPLVLRVLFDHRAFGGLTNIKQLVAGFPRFVVFNVDVHRLVLLLQRILLPALELLDPVLIHLVSQVILDLVAVFAEGLEQLFGILLLQLQYPQLFVDPLHLTFLPFVVEFAGRP